MQSRFVVLLFLYRFFFCELNASRFLNKLFYCRGQFFAGHINLLMLNLYCVVMKIMGLGVRTGHTTDRCFQIVSFIHLVSLRCHSMVYLRSGSVIDCLSFFLFAAGYC